MSEPRLAAELIPQVMENFMQAVAEAQPAAPPKPLRLVLSEEQSAAIRESGIRFAIIHPDSYPSPTVGRWVVDLVECDQPTADSAVRVARGLSKERRPRDSTTPAQA
jgi:hypothetical protein